MSGNLDMVKYLHKEGYYLDCCISRNAAKCNKLNLIKWVRLMRLTWTFDFSDKASEYRHYKILKWAYKHNCPCNPQVVINILKNGDFDLLDWIIENKIPIKSKACKMIAYHGRFNILKKVMAYGCYIDYKICEISMKYGYVDMIRHSHIS